MYLQHPRKLAGPIHPVPNPLGSDDILAVKVEPSDDPDTEVPAARSR